MNTREALSLLFDQGDFIALPNKPIRFSNATDKDLESELFCVNPLDGLRDHNPEKPYHRSDIPRRADFNVPKSPNMVYEDDTTPVEVQKEQIARVAHLVRLAVFSGNKSVSLILSCADSLPFDMHSESGIYDYKMAWKGMARHIESLTCLKLDPATQNCSRLTRTPGATRASTGALQAVLHTGPLVTSDFIMSHMFSGSNRKSTYAPVSVASYSEFKSLLKNEYIYRGLRNKLQNSADWAASAHMYPEILRLSLWAIDALNPSPDLLLQYMREYTFPSILAAGYDPRKVEDGVHNAYRYKGLR